MQSVFVVWEENMNEWCGNGNTEEKAESFTSIANK